MKGKFVFASTNDPDYQAILKAFEPTTQWLTEKGREDMPGREPKTGPDSCQK